jgi:hypothetical protein
MATRRCGQSGVGLRGLLFWCVVIGIGAMLAMRLFPLFNEKMKVDLALEQVASNPEIANWDKSEIVRAVMRQFEVSDVDRWTPPEFSRELVVKRTQHGRRMALAYDIRGRLCCDIDVVLMYQREFKLPRAANGP